MNLHSIRFRAPRVALWLQAWGGNGRGMGVHLWEVAEGDPPTESRPRASWASRSYWVPARLQWQAYDFREVFPSVGRDRPYVSPLCGHRSASRRARLANAYGAGNCEGCLNAASRQGIVPLTYADAQAQSPKMEALREEMTAFVAAGRPDTWPPSPSET